MSYHLLLFLQPRDERLADFQQWRKGIFAARQNITCSLFLNAVDAISGTNKYQCMNVYNFADSGSFADAQIEKELQSRSASNYLSTFHWQIYTPISELRPSLRFPATVVTVGMTVSLSSNVGEELDQWYEQEHMPALATVPGWQAGTRLRLLRASEENSEYAAPYLAIHEWGEPNEMGSESWKKAVFTPWTKRISELQSAPTHRRVWTCVWNS